jgi:hypothetical protein
VALKRQCKEYQKKHTPSEKYRVRPKLVKYMIEKGSRSFEIRCFKWFIGPIKTENLPCRLIYAIVRNVKYHQIPTQTLQANFPN